MTEHVSAKLPIVRWQGEKAVYHLVIFADNLAEQIAMHARLLRLEYGTRRGFGSVKVIARIGDTEWKSSVFPQNKSTEWVLLVSKKVMRAEDLAEGEIASVSLELL